MSWQYRLVPEGGTFDEEALAQMRACLQSMPILVREGDVFCVFDTAGDRDLVAEEIAGGFLGREGKAYVPGAEFVRVTPGEVVFSLYGHRTVITRLADFISWCQQRWPSVLKNQMDLPISPDALVKTFASDF
jgi:hypothetical protein